MGAGTVVGGRVGFACREGFAGLRWSAAFRVGFVSLPGAVM